MRTTGIKTNANGDYWCNMWINGKLKLCIAKCTDSQNQIYRVKTSGITIITEENKNINENIKKGVAKKTDLWQPIEKLPGFYQKYVKESEINEFFNWNYK